MNSAILHVILLVICLVRIVCIFCACQNFMICCMSKQICYLCGSSLYLLKTASESVRLIKHIFIDITCGVIDYFGYKTLERAYLMKSDNKITERIQHLWLRVSIQIHGENLEKPCNFEGPNLNLICKKMPILIF